MVMEKKKSRKVSKVTFLLGKEPAVVHMFWPLSLIATWAETPCQSSSPYMKRTKANNTSVFMIF
jgi:hypothetical protein